MQYEKYPEHKKPCNGHELIPNIYAIVTLVALLPLFQYYSEALRGTPVIPGSTE